VRKKIIEIGQERTLTVIVDSDPDTGTLLVQTNEDGVAISILANGKEVVRAGETKGGRLRVSNLRARTYSIRAAKPGYDLDVAQQQVEIRKGEDKTVSFAFRRRPVTVSVPIRSSPGAEIYVDGNLAGTVPPEGIFTAPNLKPGTHTIKAQKGKQFLPSEIKIEVTERQVVEPLDLQLAAAPVTVQIRKNPQDSTVTYTRPGDSRIHAFGGTSQALPEGEYTFTARANGYKDKVLPVHITPESTPLDLTQAREDMVPAAPPPLTIVDWGSGVWTHENDWYQRKVAGPVILPKAFGTGLIHFSIHWDRGARLLGKGHVQWVLNYLDMQNYLLCELDDAGFQVDSVIQGQKPKVTAKKTPVVKQSAYTIRIHVRQDGITQEVLEESNWKLLSTVPITAAAKGKFGFLIPAGQTLFLANFNLQPDR
jgi:hypothetical protein